MEKIEKLFRKISKKDRAKLLALVNELLDKNKRQNLRTEKIKDSDFYKIRKGDFRIIFHFEINDEAVIDSIKLRNEKTYHNL
ncbi:MAG: hypothetical protein COT67_00290 [Candidatus Tagabacteria bacterium CG09_land_8_20_14_0_10_41_14]|uniref:Type II toxin-antitoxin system RelE/ParE family toxin n=2 Tax=Candidatus Tagaibacteriota TaxID=1817918 RepID=A0A2H0WM17_9BACT|nr:MAG: hypothetical protein COT67_00290 [Candidatus Tagabacteria bacterium CG09_land_8_20_14_0_10_41_14]PJE72837.1 MAG: hypothetical protein COV00_03350 [Candidatus Tagabacteria bacterium CG10_big_fil_rev_8_21_14_0_10_40_13]